MKVYSEIRIYLSMSTIGCTMVYEQARVTETVLRFSDHSHRRPRLSRNGREENPSLLGIPEAVSNSEQHPCNAIRRFVLVL